MSPNNSEELTNQISGMSNDHVTSSTNQKSDNVNLLANQRQLSPVEELSESNLSQARVDEIKVCFMFLQKESYSF